MIECIYSSEKNMANVSDKAINNVNNDTIINTPKSVDEKQILQFISFTVAE